MAHLAHYKRSGVAAMVGHYDREAERKGYHRDNIDASRTAQNFAIGADSPDALAAAVRARVGQAVAQHEQETGKRIRKDANVLSDWVITLPKDCPRDKAAAFFQTCVTAVQARYGKENVPGGFVHMDESTPHVHIPVVPVKDGRLRASKVFTRADLQGFHSYIGKACDTILGFHVSVELDPQDAGAKQLSHLKQKDYKLAKDELRDAQEKALRATEKAAEATKAAAVAENARKAAESRKRDSEAAAEASEKARKQAASDAESAKEDLETQRRRAKQLGPEGKGIDWQYQDGHVEHESSVGEVRAARDAEERLRSVAIKQRETAEADAMSASLDAASARSEAEAWQAMVRDVQGISYKDEDGHERMGIKGMEQAYAAAQERLKAAQAAETVAVQQAQKAQDAAQGTEQYLAHAKADLQKSLAEAARAKQERDRYARERLIDWTEIDSAIAEVARYVATVVVSLWDSARDFAVSVWQAWRGEWGRAITAKVGYSEQYHDELSVEQMAGVCVEQRRPDIAHALGVDEEREERGYDDWER